MKIESYQISPPVSGLLDQPNLKDLPSSNPTTEQEWIDLIWAAYDEYVSGGFPGSKTAKQIEAINNIKSQIEHEIETIHKLFEEYGFLPSSANILNINNLIASIYGIEGCASNFSKDILNKLYIARLPLDNDLFNLRKEQVKKFETDIISTLTNFELLLATSTSLTSEEKQKLQTSIEDLNHELSQLRAEKSKTETELRESIITLSPTLLNSMEEALKKANTTINEIKAKGNSVSGDFPMDNSKDGFDTSIPRKKDGSIDTDALSRKLHDLLYYMYHGDCSNFNIYTAIAGYLTNIAGVWDQLSPADQASFNNIMNEVPKNGEKSLGKVLAESVIYGKFYMVDGNDELLSKFIDELINKLEGKNSPFIQDFLSSIKDVRANFDEWKDKHVTIGGNWKMSFQEFLREQSYKNASLGRSEEMNGIFASIMRAKVKELEAIANGDPFLLFYLLLMLLFQNDDNYQTQIGGVGQAIEKLAELGNDAADLGILFQQITQRAQTDATPEDYEKSFEMIKKFMSDAKTFCEEFKNDPRFSSSFAELEDAFNHLFSTDPEKGLSTKYKDRDGVDKYAGNKGDSTIGQYFEDVKDSSDASIKSTFVKDFYNLCAPGKATQDINPKTDQPYAPQIGQHYTQLTADIQAFTKAPINMNSTLTIEMEDIKATAEQYAAMITKFAKEPNELVSRMLQRIQK